MLRCMLTWIGIDALKNVLRGRPYDFAADKMGLTRYPLAADTALTPSEDKYHRLMGSLPGFSI